MRDEIKSLVIIVVVALVAAAAVKIASQCNTAHSVVGQQGEVPCK